MLKGSTLLITGGTGKFDNAVAARLLPSGAKEIRIFRRDEKNQDDLRRRWTDQRIEFYIGDVRYEQSLKDAMAGIDFVFQAAALKQASSCECFSVKVVRRNALGTKTS